jgi:hypothetical protein
LQSGIVPESAHQIDNATLGGRSLCVICQGIC